MENLEIYNKYRNVPSEALKPFDNGNFKGTDINSMWRIKCLTEQFGVVGHGWTTRVLRTWTETDANTNEVLAFAEIEMKVKVDGEWGEPFTATGGNKLSTYVKSKDYYKTSDEAFKMAITDAFGVACKYLGIGADVYWANDKSKYTESDIAENKPKTAPASQVANKVVEEGEPERISILTVEQAKNFEFDMKGKTYKVGECTNEQLFWLRDNAKDKLLEAVEIVLMDKAHTGNIK